MMNVMLLIKKSTVLIFIIFLSMLAGCGSDDKKEESNQPKVIEGKILEIMNENEILLEISKERGGYKKGDIVTVYYRDFYLEEYIGDEVIRTLSAPKLGDEVSLAFLPQDVNQTNENDYINAKEINKYIIIDNQYTDAIN